MTRAQYRRASRLLSRAWLHLSDRLLWDVDRAAFYELSRAMDRLHNAWRRSRAR